MKEKPKGQVSCLQRLSASKVQHKPIKTHRTGPKMVLTTYATWDGFATKETIKMCVRVFTWTWHYLCIHGNFHDPSVIYLQHEVEELSATVVFVFLIVTSIGNHQSFCRLYMMCFCFWFNPPLIQYNYNLFFVGTGAADELYDLYAQVRVWFNRTCNKQLSKY